MLQSTKVQMIVMLAIGGLLGYVVASGKLGALGQANGEQSRQSVADKESGSVQECAACSPEGLTKGQLVAMADSKLRTLGAPARGTADEVIVFEIVLPSATQLEIDGNKTEETGERRTFQTPALKEGVRYNYTLKATLGDKTVTRQMHIAHGAANTIDLRPDFTGAGAAKPTPKALTQKPADSQKPNILFIMGDDIG